MHSLSLFLHCFKALISGWHFHSDCGFSLVNLLESKLLQFLVVIGEYFDLAFILIISSNYVHYDAFTDLHAVCLIVSKIIVC